MGDAVLEDFRQPRSQVLIGTGRREPWERGWIFVEKIVPLWHNTYTYTYTGDSIQQ